MFLALNGLGALKVVTAIRDEVAGKVVIDITNAIDFSEGYLTLFVSGGSDSLSEQMQRAAPDARVVKSLNTVTAKVMVEPMSIGDDHVMFVAGNDEAARAEVSTLLRTWFGWREVMDLGDLTGARAMEAHLMMWLRIMNATGTPMFNVAIRT